MLTRRKFMQVVAGGSAAVVATLSYANAPIEHTFIEPQFNKWALQRQATLALMAGSLSGKLQQEEFNELVSQVNNQLLYVGLRWTAAQGYIRRQSKASPQYLVHYWNKYPDRGLLDDRLMDIDASRRKELDALIDNNEYLTHPHKLVDEAIKICKTQLV